MLEFRAAPLFDMAAHADARRFEGWVILREMFIGGHSFAAVLDGVVIALCGVYRLADGNGEFWFWCKSDLAARHIAAFIRFGRLTLPALPYPAILFVNPSAAGARMGLMLGFSGHCLVADKTETWICN